MANSMTGSDPDPFPDPLIDRLLAVIDPGAHGARPTEVHRSDEHNNDLVSVRFDDDRTLMVKRARYDWQAERFESSRTAARLLRERAGVVAPVHLDLPVDIDAYPVQAYWRITLPTLKDLWPGLSDAARATALENWGSLLRSVHTVRFDGFGPIPTREPLPLRSFLEADLTDRLRPAVAGVWPDGGSAVDRLIDTIPDAAARAAGRSPQLVHGDLHMDNVLCEVDGDIVRCVGLLDLEAAVAGLPEADLASAQVLHGPSFGHPLPAGWFDRLRTGYGDDLDAPLLTFFRIYHMTNMGFYSALVGRDGHAASVARMADREARILQSSVLVRA